MSLPPATQDVSEHPGKGSVTVPVDRSDKDRDVRRKVGTVFSPFRRYEC